MAIAPALVVSVFGSFSAPNCSKHDESMSSNTGPGWKSGGSSLKSLAALHSSSDVSIKSRSLAESLMVSSLTLLSAGTGDEAHRSWLLPQSIANSGGTGDDAHTTWLLSESIGSCSSSLSRSPPMMESSDISGELGSDIGARESKVPASFSRR
uniref:Putative secreted protein n=1 Tax=Ixodes ricinus TaxID=34613 RepID=A0A6B0UVX2_IXORI